MLKLLLLLILSTFAITKEIHYHYHFAKNNQNQHEDIFDICYDCDQGYYCKDMIFIGKHCAKK